MAGLPAKKYDFPAMTRKEFSAKHEEYMRKGSRTCVQTICSLALFCAAAGFLLNHLQQRFGFGVSENTKTILSVVILIGGLVGLIVSDGPMARKFGLICPSCRRHLTPLDTRKKLLLTGQCPHCGNGVFDAEPANRAAAPGPLNRQDFKAKLEAFNRQTNRQLVKLLVMMVAAMIASVPITKSFQRFVDGGGLDSVTPTQWKWFVGLALGSVCVAAAGIFIFAFRAKFNVRPLPCPDCGRSLAAAGRAALETGGCIYCGCRLFEGPPSEKTS